MRPIFPSILALVLTLGLLSPVELISSPAEETLAVRQLRRLVEEENRILSRWQGDDPSLQEEEMGQLFQRLIYRYDRFVREHPEFVPGLVSYGLLLDRLGMHDEALPLFLQANALDSQIAVVKNQLGNYQRAEGEVASALGYYLAATDLEPQEPLYHFQIGQLLLENREALVEADVLSEDEYDERMLEAFHRASQLGSNDEIQYAYHHGMAYYGLLKPRWEEALEHWTELEGRYFSPLEKQTIRLHRAKVLAEMGYFDQVIEILDSVDDPILERQVAALKKSFPDLAAMDGDQTLQ